MQMVGVRMHFLQGEAFDQCMTQYHCGWQVQFIEWCCKEKMTD